MCVSFKNCVINKYSYKKDIMLTYNKHRIGLAVNNITYWMNLRMEK